MTKQLGTAARNAMLDAFETNIGVSAKLRIYTGAPPANCAAAATGTLLCDIALPSDYLSAASAGNKTLLGTWTGTGAAAGTAGYYRIWDSGVTVCAEQGTAAAAVPLTTNALSAANSNVLNFASTTGVAVGQNISGTGVPVGATVIAFTGTTVTMSMSSTAGVANTTAISFTADMTLDNTSIAVSQVVNVTAYSIGVGGA